MDLTDTEHQLLADLLLIRRFARTRSRTPGDKSSEHANERRSLHCSLEGGRILRRVKTPRKPGGSLEINCDFSQHRSCPRFTSTSDNSWVKLNNHIEIRRTGWASTAVCASGT